MTGDPYSFRDEYAFMWYILTTFSYVFLWIRLVSSLPQDSSRNKSQNDFITTCYGEGSHCEKKDIRISCLTFTLNSHILKYIEQPLFIFVYPGARLILPFVILSLKFCISCRLIEAVWITDNDKTGKKNVIPEHSNKLYFKYL